ncbi:hypothetical protein D1007_53468 [Hordeum vulgare]|nr:hypothetical protein D1007_53468 [Hordeum vulgare]
MKEKAVGNLVERIGESIVWGPKQEVSLQRFDHYYGEYVRIEDGESMVAEIDQQEGWAGKEVTFYAELIDLQTDSRVGYVPSKMATQLEDDEWVSQNNILALLTEPTVVAEDTGIDADGEEGTHGARKIVVDWNVVELNEKTDLVITPISDIDMAEMFGIQVDDKDKEKDDSSLSADGNTGPRNANEDEEELMRKAADDVDDTDDKELVCLYDKENPVIESRFKAWFEKGGCSRKGKREKENNEKPKRAQKGQSETVADEATIELPCDSALTVVLPCLEVLLSSVELQTEEVEQCVPSTQSAEVQTEEVGHGQVQKLRRPSGVIGKNTKSISINKLCAVEPNSGKKEKKSSGRKKQKK